MSGQPESGDALRETMKRAAVILKRANVGFALAGGFAAYARGAPAPVHDVDFVLREEDVGSALEALTEAGMRRERPPEDWLAKVYDDDVLVDLIHAPAGRPVDDGMLERADEMEVDSVRMPVLSATDLVISKLIALTDHNCNFSGELPIVRALREQIDWTEVREETRESPYAAAFLYLVERLGVVASVTENA